jgi:cytochrome c oxidase cbb3-type subunit III
VSRDRDQLLGHAEDNDGIDEYDNALPDWWLGLFVLCIVWAVGYTVDYHLVSKRSQLARYDAEMAAAEARWPSPVAGALAFDAASIAEGEQIYAQNCVACHGTDLTGGIGPSLVDATWVHGSEPEQIRAVITDGVPAKGMITWGPVLGPDRIAKVTAFVASRAGAGAIPSAPEPASAAPPAPAPAASGEEIYATNCLACHGENLEGRIGPSLVDAEWIHGSTLADIERTVTQGVPEKGMVSWGPILGAERIKAVSAWVHARSTGVE